MSYKVGDIVRMKKRTTLAKIKGFWPCGGYVLSGFDPFEKYPSAHPNGVYDESDFGPIDPEEFEGDVGLNYDHLIYVRDRL